MTLPARTGRVTFRQEALTLASNPAQGARQGGVMSGRITVFGGCGQIGRVAVKARHLRGCRLQPSLAARSRSQSRISLSDPAHHRRRRAERRLDAGDRRRNRPAHGYCERPATGGRGRLRPDGRRSPRRP